MPLTVDLSAQPERSFLHKTLIVECFKRCLVSHFDSGLALTIGAAARAVRKSDREVGWGAKNLPTLVYPSTLANLQRVFEGMAQPLRVRGPQRI
jgi:hypothetical protein